MARSNRLESLPVNLAIVNKHGVIVDVNRRWKRFAEDNGFLTEEYGVGCNYLDVCRTALGDDHPLLKEIRALLDESIPSVTWVYPCHAPGKPGWFSLVALPMISARRRLFAFMHLDVTDIMSGVAVQSRVSGNPAANPAATLHGLQGVNPPEIALEPGTVPSGDQAASPAIFLRMLTPREGRVLTLIGEGLSNAEIGRHLGVSATTVKSHVSAILKKLNLTSRAKAAVLVKRTGRS